MIQFADWGMRKELEQIWRVCFDEPARPAKYFLNNYFRRKLSDLSDREKNCGGSLFIASADCCKQG